MQPGSKDRGRRLIAVGAVWPSLVVELPPALNEHLGFCAAAEPFSVQQFVPQLAVEALDEAVLPRAAGGNEGRSDCDIAQPTHGLGSGEFGAVVRSNVFGLAETARIFTSTSCGSGSGISSPCWPVAREPGQSAGDCSHQRIHSRFNTIRRTKEARGNQPALQRAEDYLRQLRRRHRDRHLPVRLNPVSHVSS